MKDHGTVLSIQSHVSYGHVGNRVAVPVLEHLGYDVCAINTVHFSNHTGYPVVKGAECSRREIADIFDGLVMNGLLVKCDAFLSGFLGNMEIAEELALPPVKIHCSVLAEDAIKAAITDYKSKQDK